MSLPWSSSKRWLIVADGSQSRHTRALRDSLSVHWHVRVAPTAGEAARLLDEAPGLKALVVADNFGDGAAWLLIARARRRDVTVPVLLLWTRMDAEASERAAALGITYARWPLSEPVRTEWSRRLYARTFEDPRLLRARAEARAMDLPPAETGVLCGRGLGLPTGEIAHALGKEPHNVNKLTGKIRNRCSPARPWDRLISRIGSGAEPGDGDPFPGRWNGSRPPPAPSRRDSRAAGGDSFPAAGIASHA